VAVYPEGLNTSELWNKWASPIYPR
jgi:hypothetical protein